MATYKEIFGKQIKFLASDPTDTGAEGQIWYNTTLNNFRTVLNSEAWSSGSAMIRTTSGEFALGTGTQTAGLYAGGYSPYTNLTEEYNGSGWTAGGNMNLTRITGGFGTQTAAVAAGGITFPGTVGGQAEEYDGSTWTTGNALGTARAYGSGSGILTAGVFFGGSATANPTSVGNTEEYDGTSWSEQTDLTDGRRLLGSGGRGTQTASLGFGGNSAPTAYWTATEAYNGTSWTNVNSMNTGRNNLGSAGDQTSALAFGGTTGSDSAATESWDGTNWSTSPATLANARVSPPSIGTSTAALFVGGPSPDYAAGWVEEFNRSTNIVTGSAWAAGGTINTARTYGGGSGPLTSAMLIGGFNAGGLGGFMDDAETYNGTAWTTITNYPYNAVGMLGLGTAAAFVGGAGYNNSAAHVTTTNEWSGSWTATGALNQAGQGGEGTGTQTAGIAGNRSTAPGAQSEEYDGSSWTTTAATNTGNGGGCGMAGTQTAALMYSGTPKSRTESWNGSSWTAENDLNTARAHGSMGGSQITAFFGGGTLAPPTSNTTATEIYDGTSWRTDANMAAASFYQRGGTSTASTTQVAFAGSPTGTPSPLPGATEEWTEGTTAVNYKTITTS